MLGIHQNPPESTRIHLDSPDSLESGESDRNRWGTVKHWSEVVSVCNFLVECEVKSVRGIWTLFLARVMMKG